LTSWEGGRGHQSHRNFPSSGND